MTFQTRRSWVVLLGCLGAVMGVAYPRGIAQPSFFRVSPGPLNESHQALDHSEGCQACHESNRGVTNEKCINCHDHKLIKDQLINRRGLHATFTGSCVRCHPEHKGRDINIIDWKPLGGQEAFDHDRTGFSLKNDHRQIACTSCHVRRMKSGRISFLGLTQACQSCHKGIHKLTHPTLIHTCNNCHPPGQALRGMRLRDWLDPHRRFSGLSLEGKHTEQTCTQCHPKAEMPGRTPPRTCGNCHRPSHPITAKTEHCQTCHTSKTPWKAAAVDHRLFGFPLLGKHQNLACNQCHTRRSRLSYSPGNCRTCHQHRDVHQGQFIDKACTDCHIEGGTRSRPFNHNRDTRFPLLGFHANPNVKNTCVHCHPNKLYRTNTLACADCHPDKHQGQRGKDCTKCHTVFQPFQEVRKNWQHQTFPLEGAHKTVPCESCHRTNQPFEGHVPCVKCHQKSDPHGGRLGPDCAKCHRPEKGAPKFNHETMTGFARDGAHRGVACSSCHRPKPDSPPRLGCTKTQTVRSLDLTFPVMGHRCSDCHADPHGGKAGLLCNDCHTTTQFRLLKSAGTPSQKPPDHNQVWLRGHTALSPIDDETEKRACHLCHGSPTCTNCHRTRLPKNHTALWRLRGHGGAAAFDSDTCRTCHSRGTCVHCHQTSPPLNHRGAWKISHGFAAGGFANSSCYTCHQRNDCLTCHTRR